MVTLAQSAADLSPHSNIHSAQKCGHSRRFILHRIDGEMKTFTNFDLIFLSVSQLTFNNAEIHILTSP